MGYSNVDEARLAELQSLLDKNKITSKKKKGFQSFISDYAPIKEENRIESNMIESVQRPNSDLHRTNQEKQKEYNRLMSLDINAAKQKYDDSEKKLEALQNELNFAANPEFTIKRRMIVGPLRSESDIAGDIEATKAKSKQYLQDYNDAKWIADSRMTDDELNQAIADAMKAKDNDAEMYYRSILNSRSQAKDDKSTSGKVLDLIGNSAYQGLTGWNKGITSTVDVLLGKPLQAIGWEDNPISSVANYFDRQHKLQQLETEASKNALGGGTGVQVASQLTESTVAALPDAILALMTSGTSLGGKASTTAAYESANFLGKAGITAQTMARNPQYWMSFARELGSDYEEAVDSGASEYVAGLVSTVTALINAGVEIGSDGMSGIQGVPEAVKNGDKSAIRIWVEGMVEEGNEEVIQGLISRTIANATYNDAPLSSIGTGEGVIDPATMAQEWGMGAAVGGLLGGGQIALSNSKAKVFNTAADSKTGSKSFTDSEQAVLDKVYEKAVAEREADGSKLTDKEKSKLYDAIVDQMEKGGIDIDTIESTLGGDVYKAYKDTIDFEKKLKKELNELSDIETGKLTRNQLKRLEQLESMNLDDTTKRDSLRKQLDDTIYPLLENSRLAESYNQAERRKQAFKADLTQYKGKQRAAVERAINSGVLNNTYRSHELVDILSKIEADKGIVFDYTNNAKLKESGFAIEGKTVNGYVTKNGVTLNVQSSKAWQSVVGHEITHVLEGTDAYTELRNALYKYAESKGELESRKSNLTELYKNMDADIDAELTADLVGDYLFSDKDFINHLTENRTLFQKIYDEIKYLCKVATGKELTDMEKVKIEFDKAWKEVSGKGVEGKVKYSTQYSISYTTDNNPVVVVEDNILEGVPKNKWIETVKNTISEKFSNGIPVRGRLIKVNSVTRNEYANSKNTRYLRASDGSVYADKFKSANNLDEIVLASTNYINEDLKHERKDNIKEFARGDVLLRVGNNDYSAKVIVGFTGGKEMVLYDIINFTPTELSIKKERTHQGYAQAGSPRKDVSSVDTSIPQEPSGVNTSISENVENDTEKAEFSLSSISNTFYGDENMSSVAFEESDYKQTDGYKNYVDQCVNNMRQTRPDFDETVARSSVEQQIDGIVKVALAAKKAGYDIYDDATKRSKTDSKNRLLFSSLEPNSDYFTSSDISTICDKRKNFAEIYDDIVKAEESKGVPQGKRFFDNVDNYFYLHNIMAEKGLTQPCRQCYVESMRKNLAPMANAFLRLVNETDASNKSNDQLYQQSGKNKGNLKSNNAELRERVLQTFEEHPEYGMTASDLTVEILTTEDGLAQLKIQAPLIYEAFNSFYGQSKPKMPKSATPFRFGELTALLTDHNGKIKQSLVDKINSTGGFRLQSYSDFQIQNYTDVLQVIFEAGTLGLSGHAYTKVPAFLDATEGTNLKRNISIFMYKDGNEWKLDKNDSFPYELEEIYDIVRSDKSGNTGIIAVSQNKDMSAWIMANDLVGYGIPFHKSGMKMNTVRNTDVKTDDGRIIKGYSGTIDHTKQQTEVWATSSSDHKAFTKVKSGINIYSFWDFDNKSNLSKNELIEKNVKAYIDECEKAGYLPKFRDYVMNNESVLNNVLKYSKELGFAPQDATIDDISFEYKGYKIPYGYYKFLGDFGMFTPDGKASPHNILSLENYDFEKAENFFADSEELRRNEILQQFSNGEERRKYRDSNLSAEELGQIIKQKRGEVVDSVVAPVKNSLSYDGEQPSTVGTPLQDLYYEAPVREDIAPTQDIAENATTTDSNFDAPLPNDVPVTTEEANAVRDKKAKSDNEQNDKIAQVLTETPEQGKKKGRIISKVRSNFIDKGSAVEDLALKTKNRALQDKYKTIGRSEAKAQYFMENGADGVKSLKDIRQEVEQSGKVKEFFTYLYHKHNVDRMSLESKEAPNLARLTEKMQEYQLLDLKENQLRAIAMENVSKDNPKRAELVQTVRDYLVSTEIKNKPVFGDSVTAEASQETANQLEKQYPQFKQYANDVYGYMNHLRNMMVENGIISKETAELWAKMYPSYVPIGRAGKNGLAVNVPLDTNRTGVNAPIHGATGGNSDILPLFDTMAQRTIQTFKAIDKNNFGIELKNTLGSTFETSQTNLDDVIDTIDTQDGLLQEGKNGKNPTFTVFENGKRVTFDITDDLYDAMKPTSEGLSYTNKVLNKASSLHKKVLTEYNLFFTARNAIKDAQDVLINSQHPAKTYANFPQAVKELVTGKGEYVNEYWENGGKQNTYFDKSTNTFSEEKSKFKKIVGFPLEGISKANDIVEAVPRLSEYIASRKKGATVEAAMLDAARVTTDFSAGGDVTKFLNRNGATFLNASVQGAAQQVRNIREAKANGLKGMVKLAGKYALAGLPALLLNSLIWGDDEEYDELSDYVKDNYYIVGKYGEGQFVRIPKGRTLSVIQELFEQIGKTASGEETDWGNVFTLAASNLAPNNPLDNNVIAPIVQAATNKTWYGEDLVPKRLQDVPASEQYDETIDSISKWLGENTGISPYKINYVLNQYTGFIGDMFIPALTPEAERGNDSFAGNLIAPLTDQFTADKTIKNQNTSDFFSKADELKVNANSQSATDEDILKSKYMSAVNSEMSDLYKQKREIQNLPLKDSAKYSQVRSIQEKINELAKNALKSYNNVSIDNGYATVGDKHYRLENGVWTKISDKQLERQQEVTSELGISPSEYWSKTEISYFPNIDGEYEYAYDNPEKYAVAKSVGGYEAYKSYKKDLYGIKSDKDTNGKSISGSRKEKVIDYINNLDADYETKLILFKSEYPSDNTYNAEIVEYLNNREDVSYDEMVAILKELGFTVTDDGFVQWD